MSNITIWLIIIFLLSLDKALESYGDCQRKEGEGEVEEGTGGGRYMVIEGNLTWGRKHRIHYTDDIELYT